MQQAEEDLLDKFIAQSTADVEVGLSAVLKFVPAVVTFMTTSGGNPFKFDFVAQLLLLLPPNWVLVSVGPFLCTPSIHNF